MGQARERLGSQGAGEPLRAQHLRPVFGRQVRGDDGRATLVAVGKDFEQQIGTRLERAGGGLRALKTGAGAERPTIESLVDIDGFERVGVFGTPIAQRFGWATYRVFVACFAGHTEWEATLRHISEDGGRVIPELPERTPRDGAAHEVNTVTIYDFDHSGRLRHLEVYVMPLD